MLKTEKLNLQILFWYSLFLLIKHVWGVFNSSYICFSHAEIMKEQGHVNETFPFFKELLIAIGGNNALTHHDRCNSCGTRV